MDIDNRRIYDAPKRREIDASIDYTEPGCIGIRGSRLNTYGCYRTFEVIQP